MLSSQSASKKASDLSTKPWHLTWDESTKLLVVWKSGRRERIGGGASAGAISGVEVLDRNGVKV